MKTFAEDAPVRSWEAWTIKPASDGTREVIDECGHQHDSLADVRSTHRLHRNYNAFVAIEYYADGGSDVVREIRHNPRRPKGGWNRVIFDMVNA